MALDKAFSQLVNFLEAVMENNTDAINCFSDEDFAMMISSINRTSNQLTQLSKDRDEYKLTYENYMQESTKTYKAKDTELKKLNEMINNLNEKISVLNLSNSKLNTDLSELNIERNNYLKSKEVISRLESEKENLTTKVQDLRDEIQKLRIRNAAESQSKIEDLNKEINLYKEQLANAGTSNSSDSNEMIESLNGTITKLNGELNNKTSTIEKLLLEIETLKATPTFNSQERREFEETINSLKDKLKILQREQTQLPVIKAVDSLEASTLLVIKEVKPAPYLEDLASAFNLVLNTRINVPSKSLSSVVIILDPLSSDAIAQEYSSRGFQINKADDIINNTCPVIVSNQSFEEICNYLPLDKLTNIIIFDRYRSKQDAIVHQKARILYCIEDILDIKTFGLTATKCIMLGAQSEEKKTRSCQYYVDMSTFWEKGGYTREQKIATLTGSEIITNELYGKV